MMAQMARRSAMMKQMIAALINLLNPYLHCSHPLMSHPLVFQIIMIVVIGDILEIVDVVSLLCPSLQIYLFLEVSLVLYDPEVLKPEVCNFKK